jgi:hypothetical protein
MGALWELLLPPWEDQVFLMTASEKEEARLGITLCKQGDDPLHFLQRINFSLMGSEGRYANPLLP